MTRNRANVPSPRLPSLLHHKRVHPAGRMLCAGISLKALDSKLPFGIFPNTPVDA